VGHDSLGVFTGLAVLITGVIAVVGLSGRASIGENLPTPIADLAGPMPGATVEGLPGVGSAVTRVLQWSGNAGPASAEDLAQLPPSVAKVLVEFGVPLRVPVTSGQMQ
jgi:hypothetical protein